MIKSTVIKDFSDPENRAKIENLFEMFEMMQIAKSSLNEISRLIISETEHLDMNEDELRNISKIKIGNILNLLGILTFIETIKSISDPNPNEIENLTNLEKILKTIISIRKTKNNEQK